MYEHMTTYDNTNFESDPNPYVYVYASKKAMKDGMLDSEVRVKWEELPEYVRSAVAVLDAAADGEGNAYLDPVGERVNANTYVEYMVVNPALEE